MPTIYIHRQTRPQAPGHDNDHDISSFPKKNVFVMFKLFLMFIKVILTKLILLNKYCPLLITTKYQLYYTISRVHIIKISNIVRNPCNINFSPLIMIVLS